MADKERETQFIKKLASKNLGDPAQIVSDQYKEGETVWLGIIYGRASGLSYRADPGDETKQSVGLTGVFKGIPADPDLPIFKATRCYLPGEYQDIMVANVRKISPLGDGETPMPKKGQPINQVGNVVDFALKIGVQKMFRKDKTWGYMYVGDEIGDTAATDPLEEMEKKMGAKLLSLPAPEKKATKKK